MADQNLVKTVSYDLLDFDLQRGLTDNPEVEGLRQEVAALLKDFREAQANRSESLVTLDESQVPLLEPLRRNCVLCSYTKVVNRRCVEYWETRESGCENCGLRIKSHTIVINYKLVEDVIEGWGYVQVQAPEL